MDQFVDAAPAWFPDLLKPISKSTLKPSRIRGGPVTHRDTMNQMALCPATAEAIVRVRT